MAHVIDAPEATAHDPISPLTPAERALVERLNTALTREQALAELKANLQTAIEIELATIPIYLYTYYSLNRAAQSGEHIGPVQQFVNKAGGVVMSVAVEEMLHMSLSSNILFALGQPPQLYGKAPGPYPTGLPFHNPKGPPGPDGGTAVKIPLAKLSFEQLWHFLQIEYPEARDAIPQDRDWDTIGQFYSYIRALISTVHITDADFRQGAAASQIQDYNYSPNNVDTVHPCGRFDPWKPAPPAPTPAWAKPDPYPGGAAAAVYSNAADSHAGPTQLLAVSCKRDALAAIDTISDQGEGYARPGHGEEPTDDPSKREDSHYFKFLTLQAQFDRYPEHREKLAQDPTPPDPVIPTVTEAELSPLVYDYPVNPTTLDYPAEFRAISDFCNGVFQYMLIMTETVYRVPPENQKLFFNEGLHRSMIWVLDKYVQVMRGVTIPSGRFQGKALAPTFENINLGEPRTSFAALTDLGKAATATARGIARKHPDLADAMGNIEYYVGVALTQQSGGRPMHLPDVAPYWS